MERFEYKCVAIFGGGERTGRLLNHYGTDGWELVTTCLFWHYFKRPLRTTEHQTPERQATATAPAND